jgi:hypothetical protein
MIWVYKIKINNTPVNIIKFWKKDRYRLGTKSYW